MERWTDSDLRIAFEDSCKFLNFDDLKKYLIELKEKENNASVYDKFRNFIRTNHLTSKWEKYLDNYGK